MIVLNEASKVVFFLILGFIFRVFLFQDNQLLFKNICYHMGYFSVT